MESEFMAMLSQHRADFMKMKNNPKTADAWKETHEQAFQEILEVIQMIHTIGEDAAEEYYNENCIMAHYANVLDFASSVSIDMMRYANKTSNRTKTKRLSSKITTCKICGGKTHISGKTVVCDECGETEVIVSKAGKNKANNLKHSRNKIDCLIGTMKPPDKVIKLEDYAAEWMLNLHWLYDWLEYKEATFKMMKSSFTKAKWLADLYALYIQNPRDETGKWKMNIEPIEKYRWSYSEYKLIITEFHAMLCECDRLARNEYTISNMISKTDDEKYEILEAYYKENHKLPEPKETFTYKNSTYDVGNYINILKLTHDDSEFKHKLDDLFQTDIRLPGLMFNFLSLTSRKALDRFTLTEAYSYLIHHAFHFPYVKISKDDIERILELIQRFDAWMNEQIHKYKPKSTEIKKNNSKLYTCKLQCILQMPYFYKYIELASFLPVKGSDTTAAIQTDWRVFITANENRELVAPYMKEPDEKEDTKTNGRQIFQGLINPK